MVRTRARTHSLTPPLRQGGEHHFLFLLGFALVLFDIELHQQSGPPHTRGRSQASSTHKNRPRRGPGGPRVRREQEGGECWWVVSAGACRGGEHLTVVSCVRTCFKTTRVTGLRMGGFEPARWRENFCCVTPKRVARVGFATFMEHTCPSRVPEDPFFLLDSPFRSRIGRKMMRFWLLCDGLCLECWRTIYFFASSHFLVLRRLFLPSFSLHRSSRPRSSFCA